MAASGSEPIRAVLVGLGAIGSSVADACRRHRDFRIVGAMDPLRAGERLGEVEISAALDDVPPGGDVALLCTASKLSAVKPDLQLLVSAGLDVVSSCEELTLPWLTDRDIAEQIDRSARAAGKTILGCGVNPGLMQDVLPILVGTASLSPTSVTARRGIDLRRRRPQLAKKLGIGLALREWTDVQASGEVTFGHSALVESAHLVALGLGWTVEETGFSRDPIADDDGIVQGVREVASLQIAGERRIELKLTFEMGGIDIDEITVDGDPPLQLIAQGGVQGDKATVARLLAGARVVRAMPAGLRLPIEAPLWSGPR